MFQSPVSDRQMDFLLFALPEINLPDWLVPTARLRETLHVRRGRKISEEGKQSRRKATPSLPFPLRWHQTKVLRWLIPSELVAQTELRQPINLTAA